MKKTLLLLFSFLILTSCKKQERNDIDKFNELITTKDTKTFKKIFPFHDENTIIALKLFDTTMQSGGFNHKFSRNPNLEITFFRFAKNKFRQVFKDTFFFDNYPTLEIFNIDGEYKLEDVNFDGYNDFLICYYYDNRGNRGYNLFTIMNVDKDIRVNKIKNFEKLYNPFVDKEGEFIASFFAGHNNNFKFIKIKNDIIETLSQKVYDYKEKDNMNKDFNKEFILSQLTETFVEQLMYENTRAQSKSYNV